MRLTLRTLLAWLDDTLPPVQVREIGKQVADSPLAQELVQRIHRVTRQRRLTIPSRNGSDATDPNLVASYLDNDLEPENVAAYEKKCLTSDVNLAEAASVHQILSLLGQKVQVPAEAKARMYHLVRGREARPAATPNGASAAPEAVTKPIPPWEMAPPPRRRNWERFGPLAACLGLIALLCWSAYESLKPSDGVPVDLEAITLKNLTPGKVALTKTEAAPEAEPAPEVKTADADVDAPAEPSSSPKADPADPVVPKAEPVVVRNIPDGAVGVAAKVEGMLLRYNLDTREWERVEEGAGLNGSDRLLVLAPFRAVVAIGKSTLSLLGGTEIQLARKDPAEEPLIGLVHGRAVIEPSSSPNTLHILFGGRTVDLEQPADAAVGIELMNHWIYGKPPATVAVLAVHAANGEVSLTLDKTPEKLSGPETILASSNGDLDRPADAKLPAWVGEPDRSEETTALRAAFLKELSADRPVLTDLVSATDSKNDEVKALAISALRALGDPSMLIPILNRPGDPAGRRAAIAAIREEIAAGGPTTRQAFEELELEFGPDDGARVEKLLVGLGDGEGDKAAAIQLVEDLSVRDKWLGIRELAYDNLVRRTGNTSLSYDADHPEAGHAAWNRLVESTSTKLDAKPKAPK